MSKIVWDVAGEHFYETGVRNGVLYVHDGDKYGTGVAWNGLTAITESPSGAEATPLYADDIKYLNLVSAEEFGATIEAYTYPEEFAQCNGEAELIAGVTVGQQDRKVFGLCYRTTVGNDVKSNAYGYKLHLIYGALAAPSERAYSTINDSPEAITFSWEVSTTPVNVEIEGQSFKPTSYICVDAQKVGAAKMKLLEDKLYGTESDEATLPLPSEIYAILNAAQG